MTTKSCLTCPSMLGRNDLAGQIETYKMTINADSCPRKGRLLGGPKSPERSDSEDPNSIHAAVARTCDSHGAEMLPLKNRHGSMKIALPMPKLKEEHDNNYPKPTSCRTCQFFVPANSMMRETGMTSAFCARYGKILSEQNVSQEAKYCPDATGLLVTSSMDDHLADLLGDVTILPELRAHLKLGDRIGANVQQIVSTVKLDPSTYPTDKPLTAEDQARGIRAWQRIESSTGTRAVYLPIFNPAYIPDEQLALIPQAGDETNPDLYVDHQNLAFKVAVIWQLGETPALHGVAGTGKTEFFRYMAWRMQLPFHRVSITASSELDDLAGKTHYHPEKGTFFEQGRIPKAWQSKCVLVLDEPNVGPPDVWQFVRPMTDNAKQLVLDMNEGQKIDRNPSSFLGMAMNPAWDSRNVGAETISDADGSRLMHIFVEFPSEKLEMEIIKERCKLDDFDISKVQLKMVMTIAKSLRQMSEDQTLPITWGIRQQIKVARALAWFDPAEAYRLAAADYIEPEARQLILDEVISTSRGL